MSAEISSRLRSKPQGVRPGVKIFLGIVSAFLVGALIHGFLDRQGSAPEESAVPEAEAPAPKQPVSKPPRTAAVSAPISVPAPDANSALEQKGGIRVVSAHRSTKDAVIELRYTVTDVEKATGFAQTESTPYLIDLTTGDKAGVGKSVELPKGVNAHTRMRAAMLSNPQGQGFPPAPYRLVAGKTYQLLVPTLNVTFAPGTLCVLECGPLRSSPVTIEEILTQP
jgi:hypothetical protein